MNAERAKTAPNGLSEFRCSKCDKLLGVFNKAGLLESKCVRCGTLNFLSGEIEEQIIITDSKGKILFVNGEVEKITGYSSREVVGKTPSLWGGQMSEDFYENMWETILEKKQNIMVKVSNRHKSGKRYEALLRISPILDIRGKVKFFIGIESVVK